jgi:hypothetical protein
MSGDSFQLFIDLLATAPVRKSFCRTGAVGSSNLDNNQRGQAGYRFFPIDDVQQIPCLILPLFFRSSVPLHIKSLAISPPPHQACAT